MATLPTVPTFNSGDVLTAPNLNAATKTPLDFLMGQPSVRVKQTTPQLIGTTATNLTWQGTDFNNDTMWEGTTNPSRVTFTTAGLYLVTYNLGLQAGTGVVVSARIFLNGTTTIHETAAGYATNLGYTFAPGTFLRNFAAGDYIQAQLWNSSSSYNTNTSSQGGGNHLEAVWIGKTR